MKTLLALTTAAAGLSAGASAWAQNRGHMMGDSWGGGWMGGYGVPWLSVLLLVVVVGLAVWVVKRK